MDRQAAGNWLRNRLSKQFYLIVLILLAVMLELSPAIFNFFSDVETWNFTERQKALVNSRVHTEVALVGIDDKTLSSEMLRDVFGRWPYPRKAFSYLIRFLNRNPEIKMIAFDLSFDGGNDKKDPESDRIFVQSIRNSRIPVISNFITVPKDEGSPLPEVFRNYALRFTGTPQNTGYQMAGALRPPSNILLDTPMKFYSATSVLTDESGAVRRVIPFVIFDDRLDSIFPTFALATALQGETEVSISDDQNIRTPDKTYNLKHNRLPYIRWYGDARGATLGANQDTEIYSQGYADNTWGPITRFIVSRFILEKEDSLRRRPPIYREYSFADIVISEMVLECRDDPTLSFCERLRQDGTLVRPEEFNEDFVLIGITADNLSQDVHKTIYGGGPYPGVYIQANILDNFLHNDFIYQLNALWSLAGFLLLGGLTAWICLRLPIPFSIVFCTVLAGSYTIFTVWAYRELGWWVNWTYPMLALFLAFTGSYMYRYFSSEQRKQQLRFAFAKYVSPGVMQTIEKNPEQISLGGQRRELTMLFSDIRGFTTFSETHEAEFVQSFLTDYFSVMNDIVLNECGGSINKLIGDAIMAYWGFPLETEDHAYLAVRAALKMRDAMHEWNEKGDRPPVRIGVGINTGEVMIGNVGSKDFMDFTVIGDAVNTASRLEGMNKETKTNIIISETTYAKLRGRLLARPLGAVSIRGKEQKLNIYEPIAFREDLTDDQVRALEEELSDAPVVTSQAEGA